VTRFARVGTIVATASLLLAACGGGGGETETADSGSMGQAGSMGNQAEMADAGAATATIKGLVTYQGVDPVKAKLKMSADPYCEESNAKPVFDESIVLGPNGALENVFVYVKTGMEGRTFPVPAEPVVFDQKSCMYQPHIFGILTKQELQIVNSDETLHNVHATPKNSPEFNVGMPTQGMKITKKFRKAEVMVHIKCEVHPWMSAYAGVLDHPYFAVAQSGGIWELPQIAPGTYTIEAWHEKLGTQTQEVTIGDGEMKELTFNFASDVRNP